MSDNRTTGYRAREGDHTSPRSMTDVLSQSVRTTLPAATEGMNLNEPNLNIRGGRVRIEAWLDHDGVLQLEASLAALRMLLKPKAAAEPADGTPETDPPNAFAWR